MFSSREDSSAPLRTGNRVRIRESHRSPYSGRYGVISSVDSGDSKGQYVVLFEDGTQFRYRAEEVESTPAPKSRNHFFEKIMKSNFQMSLFLILVSSMVWLAACGPAPSSQSQTKAAAASEQAPVDIERPVAVEKPRTVPAVTPKPKPVSKEVPKPTAASAPKPVNAPAQPTTPAHSTASTLSTGLTLPAPVAPPIDAPVPPTDETKPVVVEPPAPRQVRVPSGTLVAVRMIDSVDSETAHVGETFKASLDAPVVIDNETVFPKGSEVYVKVSKVQSAGRLSGRSELQLQLDRIFLGRKSYMLQSNFFVNTGASQAAKTAKTSGLGAAIGAAIGAISGGGKGAVIGGATGAGAGAGVEAVRKGERVRVESETRLDFRLEESLEVTVAPSSPSQRNNPSGPPRLGTRQ